MCFLKPHNIYVTHLPQLGNTYTIIWWRSVCSQTSQHFNISTFQPWKVSTFQDFQHFKVSTLKIFNISRFQDFNIGNPNISMLKLSSNLANISTLLNAQLSRLSRFQPWGNFSFTPVGLQGGRLQGPAGTAGACSPLQGHAGLTGIGVTKGYLNIESWIQGWILRCFFVYSEILKSWNVEILKKLKCCILEILKNCQGWNLEILKRHPSHTHHPHTHTHPHAQTPLFAAQKLLTMHCFLF